MALLLLTKVHPYYLSMFRTLLKINEICVQRKFYKSIHKFFSIIIDLINSTPRY